MPIPTVSGIFEKLLEAIGLDDGLLRIVTCAFLSFPFSVIYKRLPDNRFTIKNIYIIAVAAFYLVAILQLHGGLFTLAFSSAGTYFITKYVKLPSMPWLNFVFLMLHLAYSHIHAQFTSEADKSKVDITGSQMVLVMKLSSFGWSLYDGRYGGESLTPYTKARAIYRFPNLLSYMGYVLFYPSLLTGPAFDYLDYDKFIHSTLFDDVPKDRRPGKNRKRKIPRSGFPALKKTLQGLFFAMLLLLSPKFVSVSYITSGALELEHGFIYRVLYLWLLSFCCRLKYYTIWLIAEGGCIQCGIGYNGYNRETDSFLWNRVQNIDPIGFEFGQNMHKCLESWNMNTNKWLKNYVYIRASKKNKKPGFKSTLFTFMTSAFWHGTKPGYYLTFLLGAFLQTLGKIYRRNLRPVFLEKDGVTPKKTKIIYDVLCYFAMQIALSFAVQPFVVLDLDKSIYCWSIVYYYVAIAIVLTFVIFRGPFGPQLIAWLRSHLDMYVQGEGKPQEKPQPRAKLTEKEAATLKRTFNVKPNEDDEKFSHISTGLPSIDELENMDTQEAWGDLKSIWKEFNKRSLEIKNISPKEIYEDFRKEINESL